MAGDPSNLLPGSFWSDIRLAYGLLPVTTLLERRGLDSATLLAKAGIDRFGLMDPAYTISIEQELGLMRSVITALADPHASLDLAREYRVRGFSVLGLAMQACDTPLQLLRLLLTYPRLAWGVFDCTMRLGPREFHADLTAPRTLGAAEGFLAERDIACALVVIDEVLGAPFAFEAVHFRHACAGDVATYRRFFRCDVAFGAPQHRVVVREGAIGQRMPHANATMRAFYEAQCDRMSRALDQPFRFVDSVRTRLRRSDVVPGLPTLASQMFMTPRTLQRRLSAEGASFSDLLKDVRLQRATQLLEETSRGMSSIATELGFSDAVAFSHAYKSWTGKAPQSRRRRMSRA